MRPTSLLDNQSDQPEDEIMATHNESTEAALHDLMIAVKVLESTCATKEALAAMSEALTGMSGTTKESLAVMSGRLDLLASNQQAFQNQAFQTFATKAELANMVHQLTWRMAGFTVAVMSTIVAAARYL